jgi:glutathione synthase/RimK-type ligase-like ATP-grasp enzyme
VAGLGIVIDGVDLRRDLDGHYYCFEVNPTPGFMFYQQYTGQRIGDALVDLLSGGP